MKRFPFALRLLAAAASGAGFQLLAVEQASLIGYALTAHDRGGLLFLGMMISFIAVVCVVVEGVMP